MPKTKPKPAESESPSGNPHPPRASRPLRFKILGLGGAGIKTLALLKTPSLQDAELIAVDTDVNNLKTSTDTVSIRIGELVTRGLSTGGDASLGCQAAQEEDPHLRQAIGSAELIFILAGLGGGTGGGAAPVIAQLAQQTGALTVAVTFLPFEQLESATRRAAAKENADALRGVCDATLCIPQEPLLLGSDNNPEQAFRNAETMAARMIEALVALITTRGMGEITLQDLRKAWGSCRSELAFGSGTSHHSLTDAWEQALRMPTCGEETLVQTNQIFVAARGNNLRVAETTELTDRLQQDYPNARISLFASSDSGDPPSVTIFATRPVPEVAHAKSTPSTNRVTRPRQQTLNLEPPSRGQFEKTEHTIYHGEDLDIPTYIRKNVRLR